MYEGVPSVQVGVGVRPEVSLLGVPSLPPVTTSSLTSEMLTTSRAASTPGTTSGGAGRGPDTGHGLEVN